MPKHFDPVPKRSLFVVLFHFRPLAATTKKKVASLQARLEKAEQMKNAGYRIRFRLDALARIPRWEEELAEVMGRINEIEPEMLTIGALRASNKTHLRRAAEINNRDAYRSSTTSRASILWGLKHAPMASSIPAPSEG